MKVRATCLFLLVVFVFVLGRGVRIVVFLLLFYDVLPGLWALPGPRLDLASDGFAWSLGFAWSSF